MQAPAPLPVLDLPVVPGRRDREAPAPVGRVVPVARAAGVVVPMPRRPDLDGAERPAALPCRRPRGLLAVEDARRHRSASRTCASLSPPASLPFAMRKKLRDATPPRLLISFSS